MMHQWLVFIRYLTAISWGLIFIFFILLNTCFAHELNENRASLVLRNDTSLSVILYINIGQALHKTLAPQRDQFEFIGFLSSLNEIEFSKQWLLATRKLESQIHVLPKSGQSFKLSALNWGDPKVAQRHLQESTMRAVIEKNKHLHSEPYEVKFQINNPTPISSVTLDIPEALQPMTIVSNRIKQTHTSTGKNKTVIDF